MKRCLWVVPKGIFPVRDGARVANQALLKSVRPHFNEMDIMVFNEEDSDELHIAHYNSDFNPTNVFFFKKLSYQNIIKKLFFLTLTFFKAPHLPVTTGYFHTEKIKKEVHQVLKHRKYDLIVFDGIHPYTAFMDIKEFKNIPVAYRAHNVEGDLWSTAASKTNNIIIQKLLLWQGKKMLDLEVNLINRSTRTWNIAEEDLKRYKEILNGDDKKLTVIPVGLEFKRSIAGKVFSNNESIKLLFLGKMDWAPNKDGLKWFLEDVWPHVDSQKFELQIVGSGDSRWGTELFKQTGIKFIGFAKDLEAVYANCDFSVIPIRYGSGTRIKVIESISKGVPIVSTNMGVQGSGLKDFFHAETKDEWVKVLSSLDKVKGQKMAQAAFVELEKMYSPVSIGEKAYSSIKV
ncbi:MAG: glycosyltransferase family 4 protein [Bacteriovorax sp.]|nr:glycosyltransferase family 4 protein [Bacteriovorax sp.]